MKKTIMLLLHSDRVPEPYRKEFLMFIEVTNLKWIPLGGVVRSLVTRVISSGGEKLDLADATSRYSLNLTDCCCTLFDEIFDLFSVIHQDVDRWEREL